MRSSYLFADALSQLTQPYVLPFLVAGLGVVGGVAVAITKAIIRHRERMAKIEHGIDPDAENDRAR
jgi:hypothetical protein